MILETGKVYKTDKYLPLYSNIDAEPNYSDGLNNKSFIFLGKTKDIDFPEEAKKSYWYKVLVSGKIAYLWINETAQYNFKLVE